MFDLPNITPDSLTGAILAIEGIRDGAVLLNGPTGCKFYHGAVSENQMPRAASYDPLQYRDNFYFGQPRVPATYLDNDDYVFGASEKLAEILPVVAARGHKFLAIINTPGAALIGDDLERFVNQSEINTPVLSIESTSYSGQMAEGWSTALSDMMSKVVDKISSPEPSTISSQKSVNLLGLNLYQKYWEGDTAELTNLLDLCGITVLSTPGAGDNFADILKAPQADLNVVVFAEFGQQLADTMEKLWQTPNISPTLPIGFQACENWIQEICAKLDVDPSPALEAIKAAKKRAIMYLKPFHGLSGLPKGLSFAVQTNSELDSSLSVWLENYLGMVPVEKLGFSALSADVFLADGASLADPLIEREEQVQIEIALPSRGKIHLISKCILGIQGCLYLLEWLLNEIDIKIHRRQRFQKARL